MIYLTLKKWLIDSNRRPINVHVSKHMEWILDHDKLKVWVNKLIK